MPLTVTQFTERLAASGLMDAELVNAFVESLPGDSPGQTDAEQLARDLVKQKKLTKFQAEQIYLGKGASLTLGNYVILDKLGQGGMGMVLKAEHRRMKRLVAIKVMSPAAVKTPDALKRFHREVEAAAKLRHPNIVAADDADEAKGTHFLVMEYVEGSDLSVLVKKNGPIPIDQAVRCIIQAARGLEFAHKRGVIHRDIKPANLLLDHEGTVKILDMGLARIEDSVGGSSEGAGLTSTGTIMGTVDYMSPEQAMDTKQADARSDIYSLGCSLYYLLTGKCLYDGDTIMKKLIAHRESPIPDLRSPVSPRQESRTSPDVGSSTGIAGIDGASAFVSRSDTATLNALDAVFRRMVAKKPQDRPQSMTEVIAMLERCLSGSDAKVTVPPSASSGSGESLQSFLQEISGGNSGLVTRTLPASKTTLPQSQTAASADPALNATMISSSAELTTDPQTQTSLMESAPKNGTGSALLSSRRNQLIAGLAASVLLVLGIAWWSTSKPQSRPEKNVATNSSEMSKSPSSTEPASEPPKPAIAPFDAKQARAHQEAWAKHLGVPVEYTNSIGMKFVLIPPGAFMMGSTPEEIEAALKQIDPNATSWVEHIKSESPRHKVILTQPFYLGANEITQAEYEKVMSVNPAHFASTGMGKDAVAGMETANHPVENVNWNDAAEFCIKLSEREKLKPFYLRHRETITPVDGTGYRLPSEAEWEFACRAGTVTKFWIGDNDEDFVRAGWFVGNSAGRTHAVGDLLPNPFGLHDIHGNVWEWIQDVHEVTWYVQFQGKAATDPNCPFHADSPRVVRGGDWFHPLTACRSSYRHAADPKHRDDHLGFRVSLTIDAVKEQLAQKAATTPKPAVAPFDAKQARAFQEAWAKHLGVPVEYTNSIGMKFVLIPPAEFMMGSTPEEVEAALKGAGEDRRWRECIQSEAPQHKVILTQPIYLGVNEVTQAEYEKVMGVNPSNFAPMGAGKEAVAGLETANHPVEMVSWNDAAEFCAILSKQEKLKPFYFRAGETITPLDGTGYRLPSEAEWEFACRAGAVQKYWIGEKDEDLVRAGWFGGNSGSRTHAAGELKANPFGLYDIHGNVWEWVQDGWDATYYGQFQEKPAINPSSPYLGGSQRVARGGNWRDPPSNCRSSYRDARESTLRADYIGLRVSLTVDAVKEQLSRKAAAVPLPAKAPFDAQQARVHQEAWAKHLGVPVEYTNSIGMKFSLIPPGEFTMGSTPDEIEATLNQIRTEDTAWRDRAKSEGPQHLVRLTRPIYLGTTEVTQGQYESVIGKNPSHFSATGAGRKLVSGLDSRSHPVETVSWHEVNEFCSKLGRLEKLTGSLPHRTDSSGQPSADAYGLPTEAEWEFACRAGTTTSHWTGNDEASLARGARFGEQVELRTYPVGTLDANPFGLFDMHGNVWEWVRDGWDQKYYNKLKDQPVVDPLGVQPPGGMRVQRGGASRLHAMHCRSSNRGSVPPDTRLNGWGFRIALSVDAVKKQLETPKETSALQFDGNGARVEVPSLVMDPARPMTIEAWVQPSKPVTMGVVAGFADHCVLRIRGRQWWFGVRDANSVLHHVVATSDVDWQKPNHVAGVYDGTHLRLFVDGIRHGEPVPCSGVMAANGMATFGAALDGKDPFAGQILQVRFSNVSRYTDDFDPPASFTADANTLALYRFEDGQGARLSDSSPNQHHGKIVNAKWASNGTAKEHKIESAPRGTTSDRIAAEWVIGLGGEVLVEGVSAAIKDVKALPAQGFKLTQVRFPTKKLTGDNMNLAPLRGLEQVVFVGLDGTHASAEGIAELEQLPKLERISLGGGSGFAITDTHFAALGRLKKLKKLFLAGARVTPSHCATISQTLPNLDSLNLQGNHALDDAAVLPLGKLSNLAKLQLQGTKVTAAGVASLKKSLPNCSIEWDDPDRPK